MINVDVNAALIIVRKGKPEFNVGVMVVWIARGNKETF
ncbi:MAG: hypothetical protein BTN85_2185 [Candidatus Methanohalarchaeum thermophilum]|uniref:Uncharacterized protein n=1 Tax=Methanohalarchaeum thermophilum TaxID=1903181 RepID=A0A1Q6DT40_METT1|nr:MAG: hypothetical protein BTN85_2185 [Candidatus Methanohalarchaeum thermophilum]